jgi:hypothetical protein
MRDICRPNASSSIKRAFSVRGRDSSAGFRFLRVLGGDLLIFQLEPHAKFHAGIEEFARGKAHHGEQGPKTRLPAVLRYWL